MGTKLERAINPLASSQNANSCNFNVHFVDDYFRTRTLKENCQKIIGLDRFCSSLDMDRVLERNSMESIRKTMQMHEDIFKHQVRELHRLYSVQKKLTDELRKEIKQNRYWPTPMTSSDIKQQHLTTQTTCGYNFHVQVDPSSRERSGSCSGDTMKISRGFDLERPAGEDMSAEASAVEEDQAGPSSIMHSRINKMSIGGSDEDGTVELTLSIGGSSSSKKVPKNSIPHSEELGCANSHQSIHKEIRELDSSASFKSDKGEDFSGPNTPMSSSSSTFDQERKRPHWLFQGLSINKT
ncbi:hypothetical protein PTKIN_Ptkin11bG0124600 [Pterospermum kingtungense]